MVVPEQCLEPAFTLLAVTLPAIFRTTSPLRIIPGFTTRALRPRRLSSLPSAELTNFTASTPNRAANLLQPVCGRGDFEKCRAEFQLGAGRKIRLAQIQIEKELVSCERPAFRSAATRAIALEFMMLICMSGSGE